MDAATRQQANDIAATIPVELVTQRGRTRVYTQDGHGQRLPLYPISFPADAADKPAPSGEGTVRDYVVGVAKYKAACWMIQQMAASTDNLN